VKARLLVDSGQQSSGKAKLEALVNLVLELNLGAKHIRGRPRLGEGETVVLEVVFGLEAAGGSGLGIPDGSSPEGHAERRGGLDVESSAVNGEVLAVVGAGILEPGSLGLRCTYVSSSGEYVAGLESTTGPPKFWSARVRCSGSRQLWVGCVSSILCV
jgi:hypothetical protein